MAAIFEHSKRTVTDGWQALFVVGLMIAVLCGVVALLRDTVVVVGAVLALPILAFGAYLGVINIRMRKTFRFAVYPDRVVCESPHPRLGKSFDIALADIAAIEHAVHDDPEMSDDLSIITTTGEKLWLTTNYDNPVRKIVRLIKTLRPDVLERNRGR